MSTLPRAAAPPDPPTKPNSALPKGACDAHVHIVGAPSDFPLWEGRVEDPAKGDFKTWVSRFERHLTTLGISRTVIVHSILYGGDNRITAETVRRLGPDRARGVGLLKDGATGIEMDAFVESGLLGVRLNYVHGGLLSWGGACAMAPMLASRGMHLQMLLNTHRHVADIADDIRTLSVPLVIDHLGWPDLSLGTQDPGFQALLTLLGDGHVYVKLSGIYRLCDAPYAAAAPFVEALVTTNPEQCLWGSDWPHLMLADAAQPDAGALLNSFLELVPRDEDRRKILVDAPTRLFDF